MLSPEEKKRYTRQLLLPDFGEEAQERLKKACVFIAGAGGLGAPVALYLAAAGIGQLVIADRDEVDLSNLNRQVLHSTPKIGVAKSESAKQLLSDLNPEIEIEAHNISINHSTIAQLARKADIIVDCLDNVATRQVLNQFSIKKQIPIMHAGIDRWNAQLTLLHPPQTPCMNCLFDNVEDDNSPKPVLGAVAGITGCMQALETIKYLAGLPSDLNNKLLFFDGLSMEWTSLPLHKDNTCPVCSSL